MRKELKNNYLFLAVNSKTRELKISAITNIDSFRNMMKERWPEFEIINDNFPLRLKFEEHLIDKLMTLLKDCKKRSGNKFRTYELDNYRVQTVLRLIMGSKDLVFGSDTLLCCKCNEEFEADYSNVDSIYEFVRLDFSYCSDECKTKVTRMNNTQDRYCRCGIVFTPTKSTQFYCQQCLKK